MASTINMQDLRYLNLFERIMRIRTRFCFRYNNIIFFCVPKNLVSKAIGENGRNIKKMSETLGKRIKIVASPEEIKDAEYFMKSIIHPVTFRNFEIKDNQIIISGGSNKAALIGRNKRRLLEMQKIISEFFGKEFKVI